VEVPSGIELTSCMLCRASLKISKFFVHLQNVHDVLFDHDFFLKLNLIGKTKIEALIRDSEGLSEKSNSNYNDEELLKDPSKYPNSPQGNNDKPFSLEETIFDLEMDEPIDQEKAFHNKQYKQNLSRNPVEVKREKTDPIIILEPDEVSAAIDMIENEALKAAHSTPQKVLDSFSKSEDSISREDSYSRRSPRTCSVCSDGKIYKSNFHLKRHEKTHKKEKSSQNNPATFESYTSDLISHPLSCSLCSSGKVYQSKFHLKRHEDLHTGNKPFTCEDCSTSFTRKDHLKRHNKRMHQQ